MAHLKLEIDELWLKLVTWNATSNQSALFQSKVVIPSAYAIDSYSKYYIH